MNRPLLSRIQHTNPPSLSLFQTCTAMTVPSLIQAYRTQEEAEKARKKPIDSTTVSRPTSPFVRSSSLCLTLRPPSPTCVGSPLRQDSVNSEDMDDCNPEASRKGNRRGSYSRSSVPAIAAVSSLFAGASADSFTRTLSARENPRAGSVLPVAGVKTHRASLSMPVVLHVSMGQG